MSELPDEKYLEEAQRRHKQKSIAYNIVLEFKIIQLISLPK